MPEGFRFVRRSTFIFLIRLRTDSFSDKRVASRALTGINEYNRSTSVKSFRRNSELPNRLTTLRTREQAPSQVSPYLAFQRCFLL